MSNFWAGDFSGAGSGGFDMFSSTSAQSSSGFLGDYASIKNGSYRKLLNSYYKNVGGRNGSSETSSASDVKDSRQTLDMVSDASSKLKNSVSKVKSLFQTKENENGLSYVDYDKDKMYDALKDFVDSYNKTLDAASGSDTTGILRSAQSMVSYSAKNKHALESVGISVGSDNKLSIDKEKFMSDDTSKAAVESLFKSTGGYSYQVSSKASNMKIAADDGIKRLKGHRSTSKTYTSPLSISTSKDSSKTLGTIQDAADKARKSVDKLLNTGSSSLFNKVDKKKEDGTVYSDYDRDAIYSAVKDFADKYNSLVKKTGESSTDSISQAGRTLVNYAKSNKSAMEAVGITIDSDNNISVDEEKFKNADMSKVKSLFQGSNSFGRMAQQQIEKIRSYAETEASKSNTYNSNGSYSYNYNSGNWYASYM